MDSLKREAVITFHFQDSHVCLLTPSKSVRITEEVYLPRDLNGFCFNSGVILLGVAKQIYSKLQPTHLT